MKKKEKKKEEKEDKLEYYSLKKIMKHNAHYNIIFGERSNGKTYAVLEYGLRNYCKTGEQTAIVRRFKEDFRGKRGQSMYNALVSNGLVSQLTNGVYDSVYYYASKWYLSKYDEKLQKNINDTEPFAYGFSISDMEHDKSTSYPDITTILFDEFLTRNVYLPDEFILFMNTISTIVRQRNNVKIFMLGNTVNKYSPYFKEMGLKHVPEMKKGSIELYTYGDTDLKVAVEYAESLNKKGNKPSNVYYAFDNPKLNMITGGAWEINIYPHLPCKYKPRDIVFTYFIYFDDILLQCEIIEVDNTVFTYIHRKTTPLKEDSEDVVFTPEYNPKPNYIRNIRRNTTELERKIAQFFIKDKVFYQDNEVGEVVRNYLQFCTTDNTIKR